jgi:hypothetical protein
MESPPVTRIALLGLLALVPVAAYAALLGRPVVAISLVSVLVIGAALALMVGPSQQEIRNRLVGR